MKDTNEQAVYVKLIGDQVLKARKAASKRPIPMNVEIEREIDRLVRLVLTTSRNEDNIEMLRHVFFSLNSLLDQMGYAGVPNIQN